MASSAGIAMAAVARASAKAHVGATTLVAKVEVCTG